VIVVGDGDHKVVKLRALSLWPPWGTFIARGLKRIETRSWPTDYRGTIAIHQTRAWQANVVTDFCQPGQIFHRYLQSLGFVRGYIDVPLGCVVAFADIVDCVPTEAVEGLSTVERNVGDYTPGRWAWKLENVVRLTQPYPCKGGQRLWRASVPLDLFTAVGLNPEK
jgi:hypothetical protein